MPTVLLLVLRSMPLGFIFGFFDFDFFADFFVFGVFGFAAPAFFVVAFFDGHRSVFAFFGFAVIRFCFAVPLADD